VVELPAEHQNDENRDGGITVYRQQQFGMCGVQAFEKFRLVFDYRR
jgi:hypothetical protein